LEVGVLVGEGMGVVPIALAMWEEGLGEWLVVGLERLELGLGLGKRLEVEAVGSGCGSGVGMGQVKVGEWLDLGMGGRLELGMGELLEVGVGRRLILLMTLARLLF
jgi:hypothetical protein